MDAASVLRELEERIEARQSGADMMAEHGDSAKAAIDSSVFTEVLDMIDTLRKELGLPQ